MAAALVKISQSLSGKYFPCGLRGFYGSAARSSFCTTTNTGETNDGTKTTDTTTTVTESHEHNTVNQPITSHDVSHDQQEASHEQQDATSEAADESHDHQAPNDQEAHDQSECFGEGDVKARLFQAALSQIHKHGWSRKAIIAGAELEGLPSVTHGLFPRGGSDLINHFYVQCNRDLESALEEQAKKIEQAGEKIKITSFIRSAVQDRLLMVAPYKDSWPQAMEIQALPNNALGAWCNLTDLVDTIWYHAGDRSADMNWYTKRATLAAVYKTTELHMLQDNSEELVDTWLFLDRRLTDLATFGKCVRKTTDSANTACESLIGINMLVQNILGVNRIR